MLFSEQVPQFALVQNISFNMQNPTSATVMEPLDTTSLSLLEGWPESRYLIFNDDQLVIKCGAVGCGMIFQSEDDMRILVDHYLKQEPGSLRYTIEHGMRHQMHILDTCLECGAGFRQETPDARRLFYHVTTHHPLEGDISTFEAFVLFVRKYPWRVPIDIGVPHGKQYQRTTFRLAFNHSKLSLTEGTWAKQFKRFMGYASHQEIPDAVLLEILTVPGVTELYPVHPAAFLFNVQYDPKKCRLTLDQWLGLRNFFQGLYIKAAV